MLQWPKRTHQGISQPPFSSFLFYSQWIYNWYVTLLWHYSTRTGPVLFCPFSQIRYTNEHLLIHIVQKHLQCPYAPPKPFIWSYPNNHRTDYQLQFWAITWISKIWRASYTKRQHFIHFPITAPSVRNLQALQFLCHPVCAHLQYARRNSFSLCRTIDGIPFKTY